MTSLVNRYIPPSGTIIFFH